MNRIHIERIDANLNKHEVLNIRKVLEKKKTHEYYSRIVRRGEQKKTQPYCIELLAKMENEIVKGNDQFATNTQELALLYESYVLIGIIRTVEFS